MKSIFEKNGGTYRSENGMLIPNLKAPENNKEIGKYGSLHKKFIKQNYRAFYSTLLIKGTLFDYLEKVDLKAKNELNRLIRDMAERQGVNEELKAKDQMAWVGAMNNIRHSAEEIVLDKVVYAKETI
jgi:hypothetical protein